MFDGSLSAGTALRDVDDATLVAAISGWARAAAASDAHKLEAIAELERRRCTDEHPLWACDDWDATAAEVSAALNTGHGRAIGQMELALTLRDRLPLVAARFRAGDLTSRMVSLIAKRTRLVQDPHVLQALDEVIAGAIVGWAPLSEYKLEQAVDLQVQRLDPDAVRRYRNTERTRDFTIGDPDDDAGTTSVWGKLQTTDAGLLRERLEAMVRGVCEDDPRTLAQRRADAVGALAALSSHLACRCGNPACPAAVDDGRASNIAVHVVAGQDAGTAGVIPGMAGGIVPAPLLAEVIAHGATLRPVAPPSSEAAPGYRPSTALDEFVRMRDVTCRFPGCDRPSVSADIDHTQPWPHGATHPSNLKCYCRIHHLLKTFWPGWADRQSADGTLQVTTPSGARYTTKPFGALLFPGLDQTIAGPPQVEQPPVKPGRTVMMPARKRSRAQTRQDRIDAERAENRARADADPPPF